MTKGWVDISTCHVTDLETSPTMSGSWCSVKILYPSWPVIRERISFKCGSCGDHFNILDEINTEKPCSRWSQKYLRRFESTTSATAIHYTLRTIGNTWNRSTSSVTCHIHTATRYSFLHDDPFFLSFFHFKMNVTGCRKSARKSHEAWSRNKYAHGVRNLICEK